MILIVAKTVMQNESDSAIKMTSLLLNPYLNLMNFDLLHQSFYENH